MCLPDSWASIDILSDTSHSTDVCCLPDGVLVLWQSSDSGGVLRVFFDSTDGLASG